VGAASRPPKGDGTPIVIAVIADDIYISERPDWGWVFQWRADGAGAVISTARIDPANFDLPADPDQVDRRLSAMVVRIVGTTRLGAPLVTDPTCANRETMYSVAEIDQMRPVLCTPQ
jgi:hypothetical protein